MPKAPTPPWSLPESLLNAFVKTNERIRPFLLENLPVAGSLAGNSAQRKKDET